MQADTFFNDSSFDREIRDIEYIAWLINHLFRTFYDIVSSDLELKTLCVKTHTRLWNRKGVQRLGDWPKS